MLIIAISCMQMLMFTSDVEAHLSHRLKHSGGQQIRAAHHECAVLVRQGGKGTPVLHSACGKVGV